MLRTILLVSLFTSGCAGTSARTRSLAEPADPSRNLRVVADGTPEASDRIALVVDGPDHVLAAVRDHADRIRLWHDRWIEMFAPVIPGSVAALTALRDYLARVLICP